MSDLVDIARAAAQSNLPFLLAGGHAVIVHGHARVTFDLDMIIQWFLKYGTEDFYAKLQRACGPEAGR